MTVLERVPETGNLIILGIAPDFCKRSGFMVLVLGGQTRILIYFGSFVAKGPYRGKTHIRGVLTKVTFLIYLKIGLLGSWGPFETKGSSLGTFVQKYIMG
jgi:hypothetical protein